MTKVKIEPGPCGFTTTVTAQMNDDELIDVTVASGCKSIMDMMEAVGLEVDPYEICLVKPGCGPLYEYASKNFPVHVACPVINGITKCVEAEAQLALKHTVTIEFID